VVTTVVGNGGGGLLRRPRPSLTGQHRHQLVLGDRPPVGAHVVTSTQLRRFENDARLGVDATVGESVAVGGQDRPQCLEHAFTARRLWGHGEQTDGHRL